jgi:hypothetical protein
MSKIKVNSLEGVGASTPAITIDNTSGAATANLTALNSGQFANRNVIINGEFQINQRGNKTGVNSSTYTLDRWYFDDSNGGTFSISKSGDRPDGFINSCKIDCTSTDSQGSADYVLLQQKIEGLNVQRFAKGTSSAKEFALSFYVKTNKTGVYTVELYDSPNNRSCSKTITVANSNWNRYTLLFPADTTGSFNNNNLSNLGVNFWLGAGSNLTSGTLNTAWATATLANRVSSSNVFMGDSTSNEWYITGVQLEVGSFSTEFEHKSVADDLLSCQRYYQIGPSESAPGVLAGRGAGTSAVFASIPLICTMRAVPSLSESVLSGVYAYTYNSRPQASNGTVTTNSSNYNAHGGYLNLLISGFGGNISDDRICNIGGFATGDKIILNAEL